MGSESETIDLAGRFVPGQEIDSQNEKEVGLNGIHVVERNDSSLDGAPLTDSTLRFAV